MPIFSGKKVSKNDVPVVVAAEGYTENDFGRIMYECAVNDMRLFNAAIARDFHEATALNEGTMLESEIQALQEFSIKEAWNGLIEKLKKFWAKIKGVFKNAYAKIAMWINRNVKSYIAEHKRSLLKKDLTECPCPMYMNPKGKAFDKFEMVGSYNHAPALKKLIDGKAISELEATYGIMEIEIPDVDELCKNGLESFVDKPDSKLTFGDSYWHGNVQALLDNLGNSSDYLKELRKMSKEVDDSFKNMIRDLNKLAKKHDEKDHNDYKHASDIVSKYQMMVNAHSAASIKLVRKLIANDRGLLGVLLSYKPKKEDKEEVKAESALLEMAYAVGFNALHEEMEGETPESIAAAAEEQNISIDITVNGDENVEVNVDDNTDDE